MVPHSSKLNYEKGEKNIHTHVNLFYISKFNMNMKCANLQVSKCFISMQQMR